MAAVMLLMCGCSDGDSSELSIYVPESFAESEIDYTDDAEFEAALNRGEYLVGKVVRFKVKEIHPDSYYGFNLWAGKHLNFIFPGRVEVDPGDEVTVKVSTVFRHDNDTYDSWIINSTKVYKSGIERSDYTRELSIDNVNFCVPEECKEKAGDNTIKYYYFYPDGGFIMTSCYDTTVGVSIHNDSAIEGLVRGLREGGNVSGLDYEKTYVNNIPILLIKMKMEYQQATAYTYSVYLMSDKHLVSFGISSYDSYDDAKTKCDDLISTISISEPEDDPDSYFTDPEVISTMIIHVPKDAIRTDISNGSTAYAKDGRTIIVVVGEKVTMLTSPEMNKELNAVSGEWITVDNTMGYKFERNSDNNTVGVIFNTKYKGVIISLSSETSIEDARRYFDAFLKGVSL